MAAHAQTIQDLGSIKDYFGLLSKDKRHINPIQFRDFMGPYTTMTDVARTLKVQRTALYKEEARVSEEFVKNKLVFIALSADLAKELLGNREKAREWVLTPNSFFFGMSPFEVCLEGSGKTVVEFLLERSGKLRHEKKD